MPPALYTSQTMYYATFKKVATNTVILIPEEAYRGLSAENQMYFVSLEELGFTDMERITCASLIDWLRSVRRIHNHTEALYKDAVEDADMWKGSHAAPGCIRHDLVHYQIAVKETAAALAAARSHCKDVFGTVAAALRHYHSA
jgi:hypothetical protein